jgi:hypothetical protein
MGLLALIGVLDDLGEVSPRTKLGIQVVAALLMTSWADHFLRGLGDLFGRGPIDRSTGASPWPNGSCMCAGRGCAARTVWVKSRFQPIGACRTMPVWAGGARHRDCRRLHAQVPQDPAAGGGSVGIAKSSVSRRFIEASAAQLAALQKRRFDDVDLLAIYIDGIVVARRHVLVAIGVDATGTKHLLGLADGATENARVVKDLLSDLIARGVDPSREYLFVIDGAKALAAAIEELFGDRAHVQRCRTHKVRNVVERLPKELAAQVKSVMHAAYKLTPKEGMAKLRQQAKWLQAEHPDAAASLLEGLAETFTVNRMNLSPQLIRCLSTTNLVENPNGIVRATTRRVKNYRDAAMTLRWVAAGFLEAEKSFRKIQGIKDLWTLKAALHRPIDARAVDDGRKAA